MFFSMTIWQVPGFKRFVILRYSEGSSRLRGEAGSFGVPQDIEMPEGEMLKTGISMMKSVACVAFTLISLLAGCGSQAMKSDAPASRPSLAIDDQPTWAVASRVIGKEGIYARDVYTITIPRDDLFVSNSLGDIPTAAGLETNIYFFKCPCGRTSVTGRFVVAEYEANDVISELQTDGMIKIASLSPMLLHEKPRVLVIQFQGEGEIDQLAKRIRGALEYTGDSRMPAQKLLDR